MTAKGVKAPRGAEGCEMFHVKQNRIVSFPDAEFQEYAVQNVFHVTSAGNAPEFAPSQTDILGQELRWLSFSGPPQSSDGLA